MKHRQTQHRRPGVAVQVGIAVCLLQMRMGYAQLTDLTQTTPHVPCSSIGKSLEEQIGAGQGDEWTPGASIYLIKRDPARSIRRGRQLFQRKFTTAQGLGPRVDADAFGNIHDAPALGAGLTDSCAACHGRPRGAAGFGGDVATRPDSRAAPHLFGLGLIEMLADEITTDLRAVRDQAKRDAVAPGAPVTQPMWGVGTSAPYGHDGRSINLEEVILRHGGEAQASRDRFEALSEPAREHVLDFLRSLVLFPPDDTASNLNPAVADGDPQTDHGSIHLGALFQIDTEGPE